ncbi:MAG: class I SAM-dependent methyltransferase [Betaproteobacteria bacterium]
MSDFPVASWDEGGSRQSARWRSERDLPPPRRIVVADDTLIAEAAYRLASEGTGILWRGDFQNARQLLNAVARRIDDRRSAKAPATATSPRSMPPADVDAFNRHRQLQSQRARTLGMLLLPFSADHVISLRRAPDVAVACAEAYGPGDVPYVASLRELLGVIGAHEWRRRGIPVPALGSAIHPYYGVFAPVRSEYVSLVANAPFAGQAPALAFDIGTGTGVLAAVLARRGVPRILATELDPRALACARDNIDRLGVGAEVTVIEADLYPDGRADLVVCNPPWIPARPSSPIERAIYDDSSVMLGGFLAGLSAHLTPQGEGWLLMSNLAERLGLRSRVELLGWIDAAGLRVAGQSDARPVHPKVFDAADPLHAARRGEVTSLWRLVPR